MKIAELLNTCRDMAHECKLLKQAIEAIEQKTPMGPSSSVSVKIRDMPRGGNDDEAATNDLLDGLNARYQRDHAELVMLAADVDAAIDHLPENDKRLLRLYYVDDLTDSECAVRMGWSRRATATDNRAEIIYKLTEKA